MLTAKEAENPGCPQCVHQQDGGYYKEERCSVHYTEYVDFMGRHRTLKKCSEHNNKLDCPKFKQKIGLVRRFFRRIKC